MPGHAPHPAEGLCELGESLYKDALREGRIHRVEVDEAPCLLRLGLLRAPTECATWLLPATPDVALTRLLHDVVGTIAGQRARTAALASVLESVAPQGVAAPPRPVGSGLTVLRGFHHIDQAIDEAVEATSREALAIQPGARAPQELAAHALPP
ncbi:hypothetical protein ACQB60_45385 [Actinomycetota bacterium Odt1-20B]